MVTPALPYLRNLHLAHASNGDTGRANACNGDAQLSTTGFVVRFQW